MKRKIDALEGRLLYGAPKGALIFPFTVKLPKMVHIDDKTMKTKNPVLPTEQNIGGHWCKTTYNNSSQNSLAIKFFYENLSFN